MAWLWGINLMHFPCKNYMRMLLPIASFSKCGKFEDWAMAADMWPFRALLLYLRVWGSSRPKFLILIAHIHKSFDTCQWANSLISKERIERQISQFKILILLSLVALKCLWSKIELISQTITQLASRVVLYDTPWAPNLCNPFLYHIAKYATLWHPKCRLLCT